MDTSLSQAATSVDDATEMRADSETIKRDSDAPLPRTLRGKFVLEKRLGDGGMGTVYKALDLEAQQHRDPNPYVALKTLNADVLRGFPNARTALQREASRARQITHQNIIRVYDFFDLAPPDNECFITMELLKGQTLDVLLKAHPRGLSKRHALFLLEGICQGLQYAHDRGFVHSDLKPSNIFLTNEGTVRILDLGIATPIRNSSADGRKDTLWNPRALGALTPAYASLEQWLRMEADQRDDVYSLAVMAYEMLSGKHPFETIVDDKVERLPAPKASKLAMTPQRIRSLSRSQNAALARALQFEREKRTPTVDDFYAAISDGESDVSVRAKWIGAAAVGLLSLSIGTWILLRDAPAPNVRASQPTQTGALTTEPDSNASALTRAPEPTPKSASDARSESAELATKLGASTNPSMAQDNETFRTRCQADESRSGLEELITRGLAAQAAVAFSDSAEVRRAELKTVSDTAACIRELKTRDISSNEGNAWLKDATDLLQRAGM